MNEGDDDDEGLNEDEEANRANCDLGPVEESEEQHWDGEPCCCPSCEAEADASRREAMADRQGRLSHRDKAEAHFFAHACRDYDGAHWNDCDCPNCQQSKRVARAEMAADIERED